MTDPTSGSPSKAPPRLGSLSDIRSWVTVVIILGFLGAYLLNWYRNDSESLNVMNGSLIAAFAGAWGYWLGSSAAKPIGDQAQTTPPPTNTGP